MLIDEEAGKPVDKGALHSNIDLRVSHVLAKQAEAGIDVVNDGEQGRVGFQTYVTQRMSGLAGSPSGLMPGNSSSIRNLPSG